MPANAALIAEFKHESANTRKMLERIPSDKLEWQPHEKSMKLGRLATHIAELPVWVSRIILAYEYDFATFVYNPQIHENTESILQVFDERLAEALAVLETASDITLKTLWTVRRGDDVLFQLPRKVALRNFALNHIYHHRGQLSVYLRMLDILVPGMYGPSADEVMIVNMRS